MAEVVYRSRVAVNDRTHGPGSIVVEGKFCEDVDLATKILCTTNEGSALFDDMKLIANNLTAGGVVTARWEKK